MFVGAVPREVVNQLLRVTDINAGDSVYVCCSGQFRVDLAIKAAHPCARVFSNDVSLLSCALGGLLTGTPLVFRFVRNLARIEDALTGKGYISRIAALLVAMDALKYNVKTVYGERHREQYFRDCATLIGIAEARLAKRLAGRAVDASLLAISASTRSARSSRMLL